MLMHFDNKTFTTRRNLFRLIAVLCLVFMLFPVKIQKKQALSFDEDGIGGGVFFEEILYNNTESAVLEPQPFFNTRILLFDIHTVQTGDNISTLAINFGLNQDSIISVNKISNSRLLQSGRVLRIPNQDGILHTVRNGETLSAIAERYRVDQNAIQIVNELFSERIINGTELFIPGARLDWARLQEINGDLFVWPLRGAITSSFGWRRNPFNPSRRQFHNGIDIRGRTGTPVRAAMAGRVTQVGWDNVLGNFIRISHHSGYSTIYGHLQHQSTRVSRGTHVSQGQHIGNVGNTGQSTGPHLHFSVFRNGVAINPRPLMMR
jgi:murein DD-endopeptidase MepM/ murein hydrolase activator NlpD